MIWRGDEGDDKLVGFALELKLVCVKVGAEGQSDRQLQ